MAAHSKGEYTLLQKDVKWPLGLPVGGFPGPQLPSLSVSLAFLSSCYASSACCGSSKLGPVVGISAGDELWVARYILERITEVAGAVLSFDPKPIQGDWNGAGAHTNYT
ncbi:glutamine synthetase [Musa troglodytarum]|uniref:glutamine synthetase n=1 Tax=Musa troglodytarum TaxID=320322 RepID=A0A9E7HVZ4_9LILI|nr:glutamine synthetase [Musa troglodytarum]